MNKSNSEVHEYYISPAKRKKALYLTVITLFGLVALYFSLYFWISGETERLIDFENIGVIQLLIYVVGFIIVAVFSFINMNRPQVVITVDYLKIGMFKAPWDSIKRVEYKEQKLLWETLKNLHVIKKGKFQGLIPMQIQINSLENTADLMQRLKAHQVEFHEGSEDDMIPQAEVLSTLKFKKPDMPVRYRDLIFQSNGIRLGKRDILWGDVKRVEYQSANIAGFGAVTLYFQNAGGKIDSYVIKPKVTRAFQDSILYILHYATNSKINKYLPDTLSYAPSDIKADYVSIGIIIFGMILIIPMVIILVGYIFEGDSTIYPTFAMVGTFTVGILGGLLLSVRSKGWWVPISVKLLVASLTPVFAIGSILLFFHNTPPVKHIFLADVYQYSGEQNKAEDEYLKAFELAPDSIDVNYEFGLFYIDMKEPEKALPFLERAYMGKPDYWGIYMLRLIPQTHMDVQHYEEAILWCDRIISNHKKRESILKAMNQLKAEIKEKQKDI
jgi:tetratricopeptide (TPR) repeat protein